MNGPAAPILPALWAIVGTIVGSFVGACVIRIERGEGVVTGRSRCNSCGRLLTASELVPMLSFLFLKGRCRSCRAPIARVQPLAEAAGAGIALLAWGAATHWIHGWVGPVLLALLGWQLLLLGLSDARSFHLPPVATGVLAGSALLIPLSACGSLSAPEIVQVAFVQLAGGALGFVLLAAPALAYRRIRRREGLGSADPALLAALGLWLGPLGVCLALLLASAGGIAIAISWRILRRKVPADPALPLGTLLAVAGFAAAMAGYWVPGMDAVGYG